MGLRTFACWPPSACGMSSPTRRPATLSRRRLRRPTARQAAGTRRGRGRVRRCGRGPRGGGGKGGEQRQPERCGDSSVGPCVRSGGGGGCRGCGVGCGAADGGCGAWCGRRRRWRRRWPRRRRRRWPEAAEEGRTHGRGVRTIRQPVDVLGSRRPDWRARPLRADHGGDARRALRRPRSATIFLAATSGIRTTSLVEWWFVYDPEQEGLDEPRSKARLHEARRQLGLPSHRPWPQEPHRHVWIDPKTGRPPDGAWVPRKAESRLSAKFEERRRRVNGELRKVGEGAISPEEFLAARLFTGPMGDKYNTVLRALGAHKIGAMRRDDQLAFMSEGSLEELMQPGGTRDTLARRFEETCHGNTYTATITTLSQAVGKLGRIVRGATPLYLQVRDGRPPAPPPPPPRRRCRRSSACRRRLGGGPRATAARSAAESSLRSSARAPIATPPCALRARRGAGAHSAGAGRRRPRRRPLVALTIRKRQAALLAAHDARDEADVHWRYSSPRRARAAGRRRRAARRLSRRQGGMAAQRRQAGPAADCSARACARDARGRLAEEATRHANLHVAFEELKAERNELQRELTLRTAKLKREAARQGAGGCSRAARCRARSARL